MKKDLNYFDAGSLTAPFSFRLLQVLSSQFETIRYFGSTTFYNDAFVDALSELKIETNLLEISKSSGAGLYCRAINFLLLHLKLLYLTSSQSINIINFPRFRFLSSLIQLVTRGKSIVIIHNITEHGGLRRRNIGTLALLYCFDEVWVPSKHSLKELLSLYPFDFVRKKTILCQHPLLPVTPFAPEFSAPRKGNNSNEIVFWGNVKSYKGVDMLLELARYYVKMGAGKKIKILGKFDNELSSLRSALCEMPNVEVVDSFLSATDLEKLFSQQPTFVLPYQSATQSGVVYTLLFYGQQLVATNTGDLGDILAGQKLEQFLFSYGNLPSLLVALNNADKADWNQYVPELKSRFSDHLISGEIMRTSKVIS